MITGITISPLRRALALLLVVAGLIAALACAGGRAVGAADPDPHDIVFGYNDDWLKFRQQLDYAEGAGAEALRFPVGWQEIEPKQGHWRWKKYDQLHRMAAERGIGLIFTPQGSPCWAHPSVKCKFNRRGGVRPDKRYLGALANFIRRAVKRYPDLVAVEAWNEPNLTPYYLPGPNPREYARILRRIYVTVKSQRPELPVLFAGLAPIGNTVKGRRMDYMRFLRTADRNGAADYYDGMAVHTFEDLSGTQSILQRIRREQARIGHSKRGLWITEIGYSESESGSQEQQAHLLVDTYEQLRRTPGVAAMIVHRMWDVAAADRHADMGIVTIDGVKKVAYCALAEAREHPCEPDPPPED